VHCIVAFCLVKEAFGLVCCCVVRCVVAFGLVKEVQLMGCRYFADVASMNLFCFFGVMG
jgi:hypothetical protein